MTRAVIFDLFGTLVPPWPSSATEELATAMAGVFGCEAEAFANAWVADSDARMTGKLDDSLRRVCRRLGVVLTTADPALAQVLQRRVAITRGHLQLPRADAEPTLTRLRTLGVPTRLTSDCASDVPVVWPESPLAPLITTPLFSCSEGVKKPDPAIFERACARLGVMPRDCLSSATAGAASSRARRPSGCGQCSSEAAIRMAPAGAAKRSVRSAKRFACCRSRARALGDGGRGIPPCGGVTASPLRLRHPERRRETAVADLFHAEARNAAA